jgi:hypothetical protein
MSNSKHFLRDEVEDCDLQWAIALRKTGDPAALDTAAVMLSHLHKSMKCRLPRWHNKLLEVEKELVANVAMHKHSD